MLTFLPPSPHSWMSTFTGAMLSKLPAMDPPLLARSMLAFSALKYEPDRALVKAYYLQVCDGGEGRGGEGLVSSTKQCLSITSLRAPSPPLPPFVHRMPPPSTKSRLLPSALQVYSKLPLFDDYDLASMAQALAVLRRIIKQVRRSGVAAH